MSSPAEITTHLQAFRQHFPWLTNKRYFNFGGQGPLPQSAFDAIQSAQLKLQADGPFSGSVNRWLQQLGAETRIALAKILQVPSDTVTLTENVTVGWNIALWGINWQAGDRILITDCEHPGLIATVREISRRFQVAVDVCPILKTAQTGDPVAEIAAALHPQTRVLVISHILWNTGQVLPLAEIVQRCHDHTPHSVLVLVDAAQSVGMMPLALTQTEVDVYTFTGHKWCCGPAGLGGVYVRPEIREEIAPTFIGWRAIKMDAQANPIGWQPDGQRYEVATSDAPLMAGLQTVLNLHETWGDTEERYQRLCQLSRQLWQRLQQHPRTHMISAKPPLSGLVSFQVLDAAETLATDLHIKLVKDLEAESTMLRTLLHPHCVRACVHYLTLESEIEALGDRIFQWLDEN